MSRVKLFPNQNVPERFTITKPHVITNIGSIVDTVRSSTLFQPQANLTLLGKPLLLFS